MDLGQTYQQIYAPEKGVNPLMSRAHSCNKCNHLALARINTTMHPYNLGGAGGTVIVHMSLTSVSEAQFWLHAVI